MAADDTAAPASPETDPRPLMQAQVVLDRLGFTPGVIDGKEGLSTRNALSGFQEANDLPVTGELDPATVQKLGTWSTIPATRVITIPQDFAAGPFAPLPDDPAVQARLPAMGFASLDEKLAERFHTTIETLVMLNPGAGAPTPASGQPAPASGQPGAAPAQPAFSAGQQIRVPNVGHDRIELAKAKDNADWENTLASLGVGTDQPEVDRVVVSKSKGTLKAFDKAGKLVAVYTATMGSQNDPLPLGNWKVNGVARNPKFHYNPDLFWDASPGDKAAMLPPGPNSPVGVVWIDLSKEHYGIHGTPRPETIGRAESHGCVRLTNWDAARLSLMVKPGTKVEFVA
jgi:lipoprotein-anchoring transpeptidase ErfK/SrfK